MKQLPLFRNLLKDNVLGWDKSVTFHLLPVRWPLAGRVLPRFFSLLLVLALSGLAGLGLSGCEQVDWSDVQQEQALGNAKKQISLLQERKQIIINDVVTGKVKI